MALEDLDSWLVRGAAEAGIDTPALLVRRAWPVFRAPYQEPQGFAAGVEALAFVNDNRWLAYCAYGCGGAQVVSRTSRRFFCVDCLHAGTAGEGKWIRVRWPVNHAEIEAVLLARPAPASRRWELTETLRDLRRENAAHGLAEE
jgi:hypothetical protein